MFTNCPECNTDRPTQTIKPREGYSCGVCTMCSICDKQSRNCNNCGDHLPGSLVHFHGNSKGRFGLRTTCRVCHNTTQRDNYHIRKAYKFAKEGKDYMEELENLPEDKRIFLLRGKFSKFE